LDVEAILRLFPRLAAFPIPPERRPEDLWRGDAELLRRWSTGGAPQCLVLVAVDAAEAIVGVALTQLREELISHEPSAHLEVLVVRADAEGHGIGQRLIEETERAVRTLGGASLTLHVFARNVRARAVYERLGFSGELIRYIKFLDRSSESPVASHPIVERGRVLALSGSLRRLSSNAVLLEAAAQLAPDPMHIVRFDRLGELPHFSPDLDGSDPATVVTALRDELAAAEGLVISSPEYAHGIPGSLKNALDWLVSGVEIVGKPVLLLNASPMAMHAQAALRETLTTMAAVVLPEAQVVVPADGRHRGSSVILEEPDLAGRLRRGLERLAEAMAVGAGRQYIRASSTDG
jgi:NAD(P)H-dependent FMN reductase/ribosomal protein S18 acetylase RimI-like enzyme